MPLDRDTFIELLGDYNDSYKKIDFIKKHYRSVHGLTIMDVAQRILPQMGDDYRAVEVAVFFKSWISQPQHLFAILHSIRDDYRVVDAIKKLYDKAHLTKSDVIKLLDYCGDDYRKVEIVKFFANSLVSSDIPSILKALKDDYRKLEVVKLLHNKGPFYMDTILSAATCMTEDEGRIKLAEEFSTSLLLSSSSHFFLLLQSLTTSEGKLQLIKKLPSAAKALERPYETLLSEVSGDEHRHSMLRSLSQITGMPIPQPGMVLALFSNEEAKQKALRYLPLNTTCNNVDSLIELLQHFHSGELKLKIFKKKVSESTTLYPSFLQALVCFNATDAVRACSYFIKATNSPTLTSEDLETALGFCEKESRIKILSQYHSKHSLTAQHVAPLLPLLPVCKEAVKLFRRLDDFSVLQEVLQDSEWSPLFVNETAMNADDNGGHSVEYSEDDDDSESSSEEEEEEDEADDEEKFDEEYAKKGIFIDRDTHIITMDINAIKKNLDKTMASYIDMIWKDDVKYDMKKKRILNNNRGLSGCSININGVDVIRESQEEVKNLARKIMKKDEKRKQQREKLKQKQQKLKVPHSWKDVPASKSSPDEEICMICMSRLRRIILLPCGHYHTCAHCTRCIIRADANKNECPLCKQEFTAVNPVFA